VEAGRTGGRASDRRDRGTEQTGAQTTHTDSHRNTQGRGKRRSVVCSSRPRSHLRSKLEITPRGAARARTVELAAVGMIASGKSLSGCKKEGLRTTRFWGRSAYRQALKPYRHPPDSLGGSSCSPFVAARPGTHADARHADSREIHTGLDERMRIASTAQLVQSLLNRPLPSR
jgi:hypothetical protein